MQVQQLPDAARLLEVSAELRAREPILTNLLGSIAEGVLGGRRFESETWLVVRDGDAVVGCATQAGRHNAVLSPMPPAAASAVGRWFAEHDPTVPGLTGPVEVVEAAALGAGRSVRIQMSDVARALSALTPADPDRKPPGAVRLATRDDVDLILEWLAAFERDAGLPHFATREHTTGQVDAGRMRLWCVDGEPVALAGHAPVVVIPGQTVGRVGPV